MSWARHVARMGREEVHTEFRWGHLRERGHLEDPGTDGRIVVRWFVRQWDVGALPGLVWLRTRIDGGHLYEGWNFNFGNTPLDWIQEQLE